MIKLFRRIRQKLIDEGNLKRYLIYAIGEILLVMIGILLAIQVNNLNEDRIKRNQINSQLANLAASLKSDITMWSRAIETNEFRSSSIQYLLEKAGISTDVLPTLSKSDSSYNSQGLLPDSLNSDYIKIAFSWFTRGFASIIIDRTGMDEINNLGLFSEIKNEELKIEIQEYYMFIDFHFSNRNIQGRVNRDNEFHDFLRDNYGWRALEIPDNTDPIEFIKKDAGIIFRLKEVRGTANWHSLQAVKSQNMAHKIIKMIELEVVR